MSKYVIVEIDGTIAKPGERLKYLKETPPNWDAFYEDCFQDEPIKNVIELVNLLFNHYKIIFCTGRRESVKKQTLNWLFKHLTFPRYHFWNLLMRPNDDFRHDTEVKPELLTKAYIYLNEIAFVLEDRDSMVKKWRELGLTCLQVSEGDF